MCNRKYKETHNWINFQVNLAKIPFDFWFSLGEAQARCQTVIDTPLHPDTARHFMQVLLTKGVQATAAIEGNTLTTKDVDGIIAGKLKLLPSQEYLGQEIDNVLSAYNYIADCAVKQPNAPLTIDEIKKINSLMLNGLDNSIAGEIRTYSVSVGENYVGVPAEDCEFLLDKLCDWLNDNTIWGQLFNGKNNIAIGIIKAILAHLYIVWIHPFGDGNGRTARAVELLLLIKNGIPTRVAHLLSNFYNKTRDNYYKNLHLSHTRGGQPEIFLQYALGGFVDELTLHQQEIESVQLTVEWKNYIHSIFSKTKSAIRQKELMLCLSDTIMQGKGHLTRDEISTLIVVTPSLQQLYQDTKRSLPRDLNELVKMKLLTFSNNVYTLKTEILRDYFSPVVTQK